MNHRLKTRENLPQTRNRPEPIRETFGRRLSRLLHLVSPAHDPAGEDNPHAAGPPDLWRRTDAIKELDEATQAFEAWELELYSLIAQTHRLAAPGWGTKVDEPFNAWFLREDGIEHNRSQEFLALKVAVLNLRSVVEWMRSGHAGYTEYDWKQLISPKGELFTYGESVRYNLKRLRLKLLIRSL
jgi:hypothetical protein